LREALAYVDSWLEYRVWKLRAPGAQVAVWFDGKIQLSKAYGLANLDSQEQLTTSHLFRIASHSKTFTATAIMQLVEAGKLRLDDTAGRWIAELAEAGSPLADVTVRELVSNSAGVIRDGVDATFWAHGRPFPNEGALLELAIREGAVRQPEATFKYSVLTNAVDGPAEELAAGILKILDKAREAEPNLPLTSGLVNSAAIPPPAAPETEIDPARFTGRFAALWGVVDVYLLGGKLFASTPSLPSPVVQPAKPEIIDETTLRIMGGSPYGSVGALFRYERDAAGRVVSLFAGGMKAWPIEDYRARAGVL
jgi:hypothetical protein